MADGVLHVFVVDAVLACAIGDLHLDKVAVSGRCVKATLSNAVSIRVPN
jgi:hypothetical protein